MDRTLTRILTAIVALLTTTALLGGLALANGTEYLDGKVRTGGAVVIPANETVHSDLYIFASSATVDGTVDGDLVVFGGQVYVNGTVNGSVLAAGGSLMLGGQTHGAVRAAGGTVTILGSVGKDAAIACGQLVVSPTSKVGQDLLFATGTTALNGAVSGSVLGTAGQYARGGTVGGTEQVQLSQSRSRAARAQPSVWDGALGALRQLVAVLAIGGLLLWLRPSVLRATDALIRTRPAASLGWGVLAIVLFVAAIIVALVAMVVLAIVLGILTLGSLVAIEIVGGLLLILASWFAFGVTWAIVVDAVAGYSVGRFVLRGGQLGRWEMPAQLALGALVVVVVTALPYVGGIAKLVVLLFGLGALALWAWTARGGPAAPAATASATA